MNKMQLTGTALAISAASIFTLVPAFAADVTIATSTVKCEGANSCKSKNGCNGNSCGSKEITTMSSKDDCEKTGGKVVE